MSRFLTVGLVLVLVAPMSGCGGSAGVPTNVESGRFVIPEVGGVISPAPDGRHLLVGDEDRLCLQSIDEGGVNCTEWAGGSNPRDLKTRWTPDSSKVVLVDRRGAQMLSDHSIWMLDTSDMSIASWAAFEGREGFAAAVTVAPGGDSVGFVGAVGEEAGIFLIEQPGEIQHLGDGRFGHSIVWDPDGSAIFYAGIREGVSQAMVDGGDPVLITESGELESMVLADVSRDGSTLLVLLIDVARTFIKGESYFALVSTKDGTVTPLKEDEEDGYVGPLQAVFSTDGKWVAYTYIDGPDSNGPYRLAIRAVDGGEEQVISSDLEAEIGTPPDGRMPLLNDMGWPVWTEGDRLIMVDYRREWAVVIELSR